MRSRKQARALYSNEIEARHEPFFYLLDSTAGKTKHLVIHSAIFGTLLTMGLLQLFDTRSFILLSGVAVCVFTFYGLGLSVVQGLPLTPCVKLTTIKRFVHDDHFIFRSKSGLSGCAVAVKFDPDRSGARYPRAHTIDPEMFSSSRRFVAGDP